MAFKRVGEEFSRKSSGSGPIQDSVVGGLSTGGFVLAATLLGDVDNDGSFETSSVQAVVYRSDNAEIIRTGGINEFLHNAQQSSVAGLGDGRFVIVWTDTRYIGGRPPGSFPPFGTPEFDVKGQIFNVDGKVGGPFTINTNEFDIQDDSHVAKLTNGGFVVAWTDHSGELGTTGADVQCRVFSESGGSGDKDILVSANAAGTQGESSVTGLANGRFVVTWTDGRNHDVRAQIFESGGSKVGREFVVNTTDGGPSDSSVAGLKDGKFVVTWSDFSRSADDATDHAIRGQMFSAGGLKIGKEFLVNTTTRGEQVNSNVVALADGRFVVTWSDRDNSSFNPDGDGVRAQVFGADGSKSGTEVLVDGDTDVFHAESSVAALSSGLFVVTWRYQREDNLQYRIAGQQFDPTNYFGDSTDETVVGGAFTDAFNGRDGDDLLRGEDGDDILNGGAGADRLLGGGGTDTVIYARESGLIANLTDPSENTGAAEGDTYKSIEDLVGSIGPDALTGNNLDNKISGSDEDFDRSGSDTIFGLAGDDVLYGLDKDDTLIGGAGKDRLLGGEGSDVGSYESAKVGVIASLAFSGNNSGDAEGDIYRSVENLTGSNFGDDLTGNAADNILIGLSGRDTLSGRGGEDMFVFSTALGGGNVDRIDDYRPADDTIRLDSDVFSAIAKGTLRVGAFRANTTGLAEDGNDRIIYKADANKLFYDPDGLDGASGVVFAILPGAPGLSASDFVVF